MVAGQWCTSQRPSLWQPCASFPLRIYLQHEPQGGTIRKQQRIYASGIRCNDQQDDALSGRDYYLCRCKQSAYQQVYDIYTDVLLCSICYLRECEFTEDYETEEIGVCRAGGDLIKKERLEDAPAFLLLVAIHLILTLPKYNTFIASERAVAISGMPSSLKSPTAKPYTVPFASPKVISLKC